MTRCSLSLASTPGFELRLAKHWMNYLLMLLVVAAGCDRDNEEPQGHHGFSANEIRHGTQRTSRSARNGAGRGIDALREGPKKGWRHAHENFQWQFPRDHWAHEGYKTEWWYFTGHLADPNTGITRFGYQATFFKVGLTPNPVRVDSGWSTETLVMGHMALSDFKTQEHRFSEAVYRVAPMLAGIGREPEAVLIWCKAPAGTSGRWTLSWTGTGFHVEIADGRQGFSFALTTEPIKDRVFQGPGGFNRRGDGPNEASLYYSFTRLKTHGRVVLDGIPFEVTGESWMDKEFGSSMLAPSQLGWDWFSLQLQQGKEIMLYMLRTADGSVDHARATFVDHEGQVTFLEPIEWSVIPKRRWRSPSGSVYPVAWEVRVLEQSYRLEARFDDQENRGIIVPDLNYWEGAVQVFGQGELVGHGFVEMTGY